MSYFKYLGYLLVGFFVSCLIFVGIVLYQVGTPTQSYQWIHELDEIKTSYADSVKTSKLLLVSGSNTLYGVSCQMIVEKTGVPCVNTALTQELGLDYILSYARSFATPKDTILIPLEYQLYLSDGTPSELLIDYVFGYDPHYLTSANLLTKARFMGGISFERVRQGIVAKLNPVSPKKSYQNRANKYGEPVDNRQDSMTEKQFKLMESWQPFNLDTYAVKDYTKRRLVEFVDWCKKNHIKVIATWPSTVKFDVYQKPEAQAYFHSIENFYQSIGVPVIGKAGDFMYEKSLFFNSVYHLNDVGRNQRTQQIIELIRPYIKGKLTQK